MKKENLENISNPNLISGITPGAALEKKSVRDIAANFAANKIGKFLKICFSILLFLCFYA